jgi:hypothetical protein
MLLSSPVRPLKVIPCNPITVILSLLPSHRLLLEKQRKKSQGNQALVILRDSRGERWESIDGVEKLIPNSCQTTEFLSLVEKVIHWGKGNGGVGILLGINFNQTGFSLSGAGGAMDCWRREYPYISLYGLMRTVAPPYHRVTHIINPNHQIIAQPILELSLQSTS